MRNLKKVLALVMVMALSLSVFAGAINTAPSAKLTDLETLNASQKEAVDVLSVLGVVNGYPDGTYQPAQTVTRAELAKMLYVIKTGSTDETFYGTSALPFNDVNGHWALSYLNYAYLNGIMVGYGDGTMRPDAAVTGAEAAKMALVALGYNPKTEGLEGSNYINNTTRLAGTAGLLKNVGGNLAQGLPRVDTAVLLYNALYASTVQYIGGAASPKTESLGSNDTITLGEEGFELLDVRATLVANDEIGVGSYWRNVLANNYVTSYKKYDKAASGQSRFVYKDYVAADAANQVGRYEDKVITVAYDADFSDIGREYRLLITKPVSSNLPSVEVRKVYGILGETSSDNYTSVSNNVDKRGTEVLKNMIDRYNAVNNPALKAEYGTKEVDATTNADVIDGTIFINGKAASFKDAKVALNKDTTAKVVSVDNDKDGTVDFLSIELYSLATINKVNEETYTIYGVGNVKKADVVLTNGDVVEGDYIAYYKNAANSKYYVKKLATVTANVSNFVDGKYTINGADYKVGSLMTTLDKSVLGEHAAVGSTIFKFVIDEDDASKFIAKVDITSETKFEKYAVVTGIENSNTVLGRAQVKLYTEDNTHLYGYVAAVDGVQDYTYVGNYLNGLAAGALVSYRQDGTNLYLYTAGSGYNGVTNQTVVADANYSGLSDLWEVTSASGKHYFKNENGVIFVGFKASGSATTDTWRAYHKGEFKMSALDEKTLNDLSGAESGSVVLGFGTGAGYDYVKAAKFEFVVTGLTLPGVIPNNESTIIATITGKAATGIVDGQFVYTYNVLNPMSTTSQSYTTSAKYGPQALLDTGKVYRLFIDSEGKIMRTELIELNGTSQDSFGTRVVQSTSASALTIGNDTFVTIGNVQYKLLDSSKVYFVKNLGATGFGTVAYEEMTFADNQRLPNLFKTNKAAAVQGPVTRSGVVELGVHAGVEGKFVTDSRVDTTAVTTNSYTVYVQYNPNTNEILNLWIDTAVVGAPISVGTPETTTVVVAKWFVPMADTIGALPGAPSANAILVG